ncbi:MAG TPA: uracil-DNA glycosylase family protein [Thermoanaerobaculia bacterium]|nr:uracil-DNA glycosylase family protein [Thermoanaerobaculia bacterium]
MPGFTFRALERHLVEIRGCRKCPGVEPPPVGALPDPALGQPRVQLVGQAPGPREKTEQRLFAYTAGTRLFTWFARIGVPEEEFRARVWMSAVIRCFPGRAPQGGDRVPAPPEIANCAPFLEWELANIAPRTVIAVGQLAIAKFLPTPAPLGERVGKVFPMERGDVAFDLVPLPHPSGRSTWLTKKENQALLDLALVGLAETPGWVETFGRRARARN